MAAVLVVGLGDVGLRVALALQQQGHQVIGLKRTAIESSLPFALVLADIRQPISAGLLPAVDAVLFIVAPHSRDTLQYQAVYHDGLQHLLDYYASADQSPSWLMVSSSSVYGQNQGEWVDETSPTQPTSATSRWLLAAEALLAEQAQHCIVRFSGIYGPGRNWLIRRAANGEAVQQTPPSYSNRIHRDDCVASLLFLINKQLAAEALDNCYLVTDNQPVPQWQVINWIAQQYGYPVPPALHLTADAPQNKRCSNARIRALGYSLLYPGYQDGYRLNGNVLT